MRLTGILLLSAIFQVSAAGRAQTITYSAHETPLIRVLSDIERQTGYNFFYRREDVEENSPVTVALKSASLHEAMKMILAGMPLDFAIEGNTILITRKESPLPSEPAPTLPPTGIHGRVTNEEGEPLEGISVKIKGTNKGATTNSNGEFMLPKVDQDAVLVFTGVNIETFEVRVKGRSMFNFAAKTRINDMKEAVINKGYYKVKQRLNTGDVSVVKAEDIEKQPVTDPILALIGRVPGLQIEQTSGIPGASYTIRLRGQNSLANGNNPLYIIDGVPFNPVSLTSPDIAATSVGKGGGTGYSTTNGLSPFNTINPENIESIEVLKDADATSIYGSRGANGVILITTKKGKAGRTRLDLGLRSGEGYIAHRLDMMNTKQYLAMRREAFRNDGVLPTESDYDVNGTWDTTRNTDWQKVFAGNTAHFTTTNLSLSGGNANTTFLLGGSYSYQSTVYPGNYNDQVSSVNLKLNHNSDNQKFKSQVTASYARDKNLLPQIDFMGWSYLYAPDSPPLYDSAGHINWENGTFNNPISRLLESASSTVDNLTSNLFLEYEIVRGLKLQSNLGYNHMEMEQLNLIPAGIYYGPIRSTDRSNSTANSSRNTWSIEPQLNYSKDAGMGRLEVLAGLSLQRSLYNTLALYGSNFSSDDLIKNIANASSITIRGNSYTDYRYIHFYTRVNYDWKDKYILNITGSRDGSSRFGPGKRFGNFGGAGAAWIFSKEAAVARALPFLSFGKLRGSYGTTGNDQISDYQYLSTYSTSGNYQSTTGLAPNRLASPDYAWEVDRKLEGAFELGFLRDRIFLTAAYFQTRTNNQLVGQPLPAQDGISSIQANLPAVIQNSGLELELNTVNIKDKNFTWTSSFNISVVRNKLLSFPNLAYNSSYSGSYVIGKPVYSLKTYHFSGLNPQTGLYTYQDLDGNGILTRDDYQLKKSIAPNYYGGFLNTFTYKGWQLDIFFHFEKKTGKNFMNSFSLPGSVNANEPEYVLRRWQKPGDQTDVARFTTGAGVTNLSSYYNVYSSDRVITDASFIRLKNVALSYTLPQSWQRGMHLQNTQVSFEAQNLLTITSYQLFDPETMSALPPLRMMTLSIRTSL